MGIGFRPFRLGRSLGVLLLFSAGLSAQQTPTRPLITKAVDENRLTVLNGNTHPLARPEFDRGAAPADLPLQRMLLVLKRSPQQERALRILLDDQQDKNSPSYHDWLTPDQFGQQFGPVDQDIQTVTSWLAAHGFQVNRVSKGRIVIEFSGTAAQVQEALHTEIHKYAMNGEEHWANSTDPAIPVALTPVVAGITSLHNFPRKPMHHVGGSFLPQKGTGFFSGSSSTVSPLFTRGGGCGLNGTSCYDLAPYDFATIYNILPLWNANSPIDGTGQAIAIVAQSDILPQDVIEFHSDFGLPPPNLNFIYNGTNPGKLATESDETESDLDVEWSSAIAKGAMIDFVVSASTNTSAGVDLSAEYIVDNNVAPILSESYGTCELNMGTAGNQFYNQLWQQAAAEGITAFVASGDSGSAGCDHNASIATQGLAVNGISSTPYNVSVGGTDFNDLQNPGTYWGSTDDAVTWASVKSYIPEMTWNNSCTNSEFFSFTGGTNAESDCNDSSSSFWPYFLPPVAGSGGASNCTVSANQSLSSCSGGYAKPSWQSGTGVPNDGKRDVPDVSLFAAGGLNAHWYVVCETDIYGGCGSNPTNTISIGGTSAFAPGWAGIMAMVNQKMQSRQGNANYVFYPLAAQPGASCDSSGTLASSCIFYDVTTGTIAMPCVTGTPNCVTNTSGDQNGVLSGYDTTAGYDLATGLGSVNVANLVNNWNSVSFQPTVSTLSLSPTTQITHGSPVNLNITVAPNSGSGTPTGLVSLLTSTGPTAGAFTLANGSVSATIDVLPGGSYTVTAHYAGDGTYGASDSSPGIPVTVSAEPSTTTVQAFTLDQNGNTVPFASSSYGSDVVYLRTTVAGQSGQGAPSGTVNLTQTLSGATTSLAGDPFALNNEGYTMTPLPVAEYPFYNAGTYSMSAKYGGDASFNPSTSPSTSFTITQAQTSTYLTVFPCSGQTGPCNISPGTIGTILATVMSSTSPFSSQPTGTVTFYSNGTPLGPPVAVDPSIDPPSAGVPITLLPLGPNSITAQYSGDRNYSGSTAPATLIGVGEAFTITASPTEIDIASPGQSGSTVLTFVAQNDLTGSATLSPSLCLYLPPQSSCNFSPSTVTFTSSTTTATVTLTVTTTASSSLAGATRRPVPGSWRGFSGIAIVGVMSACIVLLDTRRVRRGVTTLLAFAVIASATSCGGGMGSGSGTGSGGGGGGGTGGGGGGGGGTGTPPGLYYNMMVSIVINGVSQFVTVNVNVK